MTNEELVKQYQEGNSEALDALCSQNVGLIHSVVNGLRWAYAEETTRRASVTESDDLIQDGYIGLIKAAEDFEPERGTMFSTFATKYIKTDILTQIRDRGGVIHIPANKMEWLSKLRKLRRILQAPTLLEVAAFIGINEEQARDLLQLEVCMYPASLDKTISEDGETVLSDTIQADTDLIEDMENRVFNESLKAELWSSVDALSGEASEIIRRHYQNGEKLTDIGKSLHMKPGRANKIKDSALSKLRKSPVLRDYAERCEIAMNRSYYGGLSSYMRTRTSSTEKSALRIIEAEERARRMLEAEY